MNNKNITNCSYSATIESFKARLSEAGKCFIKEMSKKSYDRKWFDSKTLFNDHRIGKALKTITNYDLTLNRLTVEKVNPVDSGSFVIDYNMVDLALDLIQDIGYYDDPKYGDFSPFADYCRACLRFNLCISFNEYNMIRLFFARKYCPEWVKY